MSKPRFFFCTPCKCLSAIAYLDSASLACCNEKMTEVVPNTVDASREKHVPAVTKTAGGITVNVGSVAHPMEDKHYIAFVYVETKSGGQRKNLRAGNAPAVEFSFTGGDEPIAVYAYCNIHGLWKCDL